MSQVKATRYTNDQFHIPVHLESVDDNNVSTPVDISAATTVKAGLINNGTLVLSATDPVPETDGADWANGIVIVVFEASETKDLKPDKNFVIQIRVENGITPAPQTFQAEYIEIERGYIS